MEHISCSNSCLSRYLKLVSTPEGTKWKVSEKKQEKKNRKKILYR